MINPLQYTHTQFKLKSMFKSTRTVSTLDKEKFFLAQLKKVIEMLSLILLAALLVV